MPETWGVCWTIYKVKKEENLFWIVDMLGLEWHYCSTNLFPNIQKEDGVWSFLNQYFKNVVS